MKDRLAEFLKSENLTAVKFAEIMEIQPSSVSHIISGRNKPGFDFISKLLMRFPDLNPDWLINGEGESYRSKSVDFTGRPLRDTNVNQNVFTDVNASFQSENIDNLEGKNNAQSDTNTLFQVNYVNDLHQAEVDLHSYTEAPADNVIPTPEKNLSGELGGNSTAPENRTEIVGSRFPDQKNEKQSSVQKSSFRQIRKIILLYDDNSYEIVEK